MTKSETIESMGTEAEGLLRKDVSVTSGNNNRSNPFILKIIPPDSDNLHEHGSGKELLLTPDVKYSVDSESVSWAGATQKTSSLKDSSRNAKKKKKATVQNGEVRAPDGGWGWVVVFASMGISLVADGVSFSFGIIYIEFLRYFGASKSKTSVIGSLFMSVPLMAGPLASALVDRFGCRSMTILGGVVAAAGFVSSSLVDSIEVLCFTFGVLSGLGLALCYVTAVVCVAFWFDKKRSLANGLGVCGTGVGTFLFAPLTQALIDEYGWRGTTLILAGAFLQMCVCGAVMREPASGENASIGQKESVETMEDGGGASGRLLPVTSSFDERGSYSVSGRSAVSKRGIDSRGAVTLSLDDLPACVEINRTPPSLDIRGSGLSTSSSLKPTVENKVPSYFFTDGAALDLEDRKEGLDGNLISPAEKIAQVTRSPDSSVTVAVNKMPSDAPKKRSVTKTINSQQILLPVSSIVQLKGLRFRRNSITFRSDILYNNLYQPRALSCPDIYKSSPTPLAEEKKKAWYEDFLQIMADTMDVSMFLEWHFMLLSFSTFLLFTFFIVPYFYLAEHVIGLGYSESEASMLISIIGILNTIGMIALGWAGDQPWMNVTKTYALCLCLCGIFTGIMPLLTQSYPLLATASALFGLFFASNFSFTPVLIVELISLDRFTMAYGLILFTQGLGNLLGPPLAGWLYDITQTWNLSFYLAGFFIFISGLAIALITCTKNFTVGRSTAMKSTDVEENRGGALCKNSLLEKG